MTQPLLDRLCQREHAMSACVVTAAVAQPLLILFFSRSSHSVLFNGRFYIVFMSSEDKMFLLGCEPRLLKKKLFKCYNYYNVSLKYQLLLYCKIVHTV